MDAGWDLRVSLQLGFRDLEKGQGLSWTLGTPSADWKEPGSSCLSLLLSIRPFSPPAECLPANGREHGH